MELKKWSSAVINCRNGYLASQIYCKARLERAGKLNWSSLSHYSLWYLTASFEVAFWLLWRLSDHWKPAEVYYDCENYSRMRHECVHFYSWLLKTSRISSENGHCTTTEPNLLRTTVHMHSRVKDYYKMWRIATITCQSTCSGEWS